MPKYILATLSALGLLDSLYLTYAHYANSGVFCSLVTGCGRVLNSTYAVIGIIPVAVLGIAYYSVLLILVLVSLRPGKSTLRFAQVLGSIGCIVSLWFTYLQIFVIHSYCEYCLASAVITIIILVLLWYPFSETNEQKSS